MHAIDLLAEMFAGAKVRVVPRSIITPGGAADLRKGNVGQVQGIGLSNEGVLVLECNNAQVEVWIDVKGAGAVRALATLECNYDGARMHREKIENHNRDGADLSLLGKFGKGEA